MWLLEKLDGPIVKSEMWLLEKLDGPIVKSEIYSSDLINILE